MGFCVCILPCDDIDDKQQTYMKNHFTQTLKPGE